MFRAMYHVEVYFGYMVLVGLWDHNMGNYGGATVRVGIMWIGGFVSQGFPPELLRWLWKGRPNGMAQYC